MMPYTSAMRPSSTASDSRRRPSSHVPCRASHCALSSTRSPAAARCAHASCTSSTSRSACVDGVYGSTVSAMHGVRLGRVHGSRAQQKVGHAASAQGQLHTAHCTRQPRGTGARQTGPDAEHKCGSEWCTAHASQPHPLPVHLLPENQSHTIHMLTHTPHLPHVDAALDAAPHADLQHPLPVHLLPENPS